MKMIGFKKRVSFEQGEIPLEDLVDSGYKRKEVSLIEFQDFKIA